MYLLRCFGLESGGRTTFEGRQEPGALVARPIRHESEGRRREFVRLVASGVRLDRAAREARLDPWRALRLADSPEMLSMLAEVRPGHWATLREELA